MKYDSGSFMKLEVILSTLKQLRLSTEGLEILESLYCKFQRKHPNHSDLCLRKTLGMNGIAARYALLNQTVEVPLNGVSCNSTLP